MLLEDAFRYSEIGTVVYGAFSNSCWSLLLVVSYLWGGCVSCEQFFMLPGSKGHCCETRRCKNPANKSTDRSESKSTQQDCQTMPLDRSSGMHSQSDIAASLLSMPSGVIAAAVFVNFDQTRLRMLSHLDPVAELTPDIPVINAALLI